MEPWVINPRKVHAIKSKILSVALVIMMTTVIIFIVFKIVKMRK